MNRRMSTSIFAWLPTHSPFCFVDGDGTGADGGPSGAGGDGGGGAPSAAALTTTAAPLPNLAEWTASLERLNDSLGGKLDGLVATVRDASARDTPAAAPVDLEALTRPELVAHIVSTLTEQITSLLDSKLAPVTTQLTNLQSNVVTREAQAEVESLRTNNKDFADWKDDMIALAKQPQYAALGITDLYQLARAKNTAKASELEKKYNPPAPPRRPMFGGLTPGGAGSPGNGAKPLTSAEAGREAYREVQARHSDVLPALEGI